MDNDKEQNLISDFEKTSKGVWEDSTGLGRSTRNADYDEVHVLLVSWEDGDLPGLGKELEKLDQLFRYDLHYNTQHYRIPSSNPSIEFQSKLAEFIKTNAVRKRTLCIVYYCGHASIMKKGERTGYSSWHARQDDEGAIEWFLLQTMLLKAQADILVLLDCCDAVYKHRGLKKGKMEILAASSSGSPVPSPGQISFTSVFVRETRRRLKEHKGFTIHWMYQNLLDELTQPGLAATPVHNILSESEQQSILLAPLIPKGFSLRSRQQTSDEAGEEWTVILAASFKTDPEGEEIAQWLSRFPPNNVSKVEIIKLVSKARSLQAVGGSYESTNPTDLRVFSEPVQQTVRKKLWNLSQTIASFTNITRQSVSKILGSNDTPPLHAEMAAKDALHEISDKISDCETALSEAILLDEPTNDRGVALAQLIEIEDLVDLRRYVNGHAPKQPLVDFENDDLEQQTPDVYLPVGIHFASVNNKPLILETFEYEAGSQTSRDPSPQQLDKVKRLVNQFRLSRRASFHILPCVSYLVDRRARTMSIAFERFPGTIAAGPVSLATLFQKTRWLALGRRFQLAHALTEAVENLHLVGWLHKGLRSSNIYFPTPTDLQLVDYTQPWLFGFADARAVHDASAKLGDYSLLNNITRHPDRWGNPKRTFQKFHDIYSLGVMLVEIAGWRTITSRGRIQAMAESPRVDEFDVQKVLIEMTAQDLPHIVGQTYSTVVWTALTFEDRTKGQNEYEAGKFFREQVVEKLADLKDRI